MSARHLLAIAALGCSLTLVAAERPGASDWKLDVVQRRRGAPLRGLVVEQTASHVLIKCVVRRPGRPTIVFTEELAPAEVARVELAEPAERERLGQRLAALVRERELQTALLRKLDPARKPDPMTGETVSLQEGRWIGDDNQRAWLYDSTHFQLVSNAQPELVELAAVQLEQIYAAYTRALPPRKTVNGVTRIVLTRSVADYLALAQEQGLTLRNPAFFDAERNRVVCASDLQRLADDLERARQRHRRERDGIRQADERLRKVFDGKPPLELARPLQEARQAIETQEAENERTFRKAQAHLFQRLYHEAFHAYLASFVYPPKEGELPRWLNEGLAQVFETAVVELGEVRVGHADEQRLAAARSLIARNLFPPLADILRAGPAVFLVAHHSDRPTSDRAYLASWALAHYLLFDRKRLGTPALDDYMRALERGANPLDAFQTLAGRPLPEFEKDWIAYLNRLKPDGSAPR